jgi:hypothetical protein
MLTAFCFVEPLVAEVQKGGEIVISDKDHIATFATISTTGSTHGAVFFTSKSNASIAAVSGSDFEFYCIDQLHLALLGWQARW